MAGSVAGKVRWVGRAAVFAFGLAVVVPLFVMLMVKPAHAATITVNSTADAVAANDGVCTLREAITSANDDTASGVSAGECLAGSGTDTINFAPGISTLTLTATGGSSPSHENANVSGDLDIEAAADLTIDGGSGVTIEGTTGWSERIFDIIGASTAASRTDVIITDATIRNANATVGGVGSTSGGGIRVNGSGIVASGASLTLQRSTVTNNNSAQSGGGIYDEFRSTITLVDSTVSNNTAGNAVSGLSGGIHSSGSLSLTNSTVTGNTGVELGGGISVLGTGAATITDSIISGNTAVSAGSNTNGGGIYASTSGTVTLTGSTVSGNTADSGSSTAGEGGGIYADGATVSLKNTTVSANTARNGGQLSADGKGGGIHSSTALTLANSTIANNKAGDSGTGGVGGGIFGTNTSTTTLYNTIVAANNADIAANFAATPTSQGYNLLGENPGNLAGTDIVNSNPLLGPLANNGGPTQTHALQTGSPAIDAGNPAAPGSGPPACEGTDQRGTSRPQDGDGNSTTICDIGAFEKAAGGGGGDTTPPALDTNNDVTPSNGATKVSRTANIRATFSEPMDLDSLEADGVFTLKNTKNGTMVAPASITLSSDGKTVTFDPEPRRLGKKTRYEVRIKGGSGGAADLAVPANFMEADAVWAFTTKRR